MLHINFGKWKSKTFNFMKLQIFTDTRRPNKKGEFSVRILVNNNGKRFYFSTGITCKKAPVGWEFDKTEKSHAVKTKNLIRIMTQCQEWALDNPRATSEEAKAAMTEIATGKQIKRNDNVKVFTDYLNDFMKEKRTKSTQIVYRTTLNKIKSFDPNATFETMDRHWLERFEAHLRSEGCSTNYISIQLRNIRAVFNFAIDEGLTVNYPFRKYKIKQEQTEKRNLTAEQLRALRDLPLDGYMAEYRDMFLLMFYLIGINAADLFTLSHGDYRDGRIHYRRSKTGTLYSVKVEPEAKAIIERYKGEKHLLCPLDRYNDHRDYLHHLNDALKRMGQTYRNGVGWSGEPLFPSLSSYWSRHTWATLAASLDIPLDVISLALGHSFGNRVTQIYIEWSKSKVDDANRKVLNSLK